ncbi:MAG: hypothetical protein HYV60_18980 [Planctomycetia bacterium]|nr:hypothetical protein [Planctomycetia bacterium]
MNTNMHAQVMRRISQELSNVGTYFSAEMQRSMRDWLQRIDAARSASDVGRLNDEIEEELLIREEIHSALAR